MSEAPRFESIEVAYGCHEGLFEFHGEPRPVLITGDNGCGKSTLAEALLRALFGFHRKSAAERDILELRRPWSGRPMRTAVTIRAAGNSHLIERDFDTDQVTVRGPEPDQDFGAVVRPAGGSAQDKTYRSLLQEWLGFGKIDPLTQTVWIRQGDLSRTRLEEELLRIADGGHRAVGGALEQLEEKYHKLSRLPFDSAGRRRPKNGRLEMANEEIASLEEELRSARRRESDRRPLLVRREELELQGERLGQEVEMLESALGPLSQRETFRARLRELHRIHRQAEELLESLREARREIRAAHEQATDFAEQPRYPDDFESRAEGLRALWDERQHLRGELRSLEQAEARPAAAPPLTEPLGVPLPAWILAAGFLLGLTLTLSVGVWAGAIAALSALGLALLVGGLARRQAVGPDSAPGPDIYTSKIGERLTDLDGRLRERLDGVPDSETLTPETLADRLRQHRRQLKLAAQQGEAAGRLDRLSDEAETFLQGLDLPRTLDSALELQHDFFAAASRPEDRPAADEETSDESAEEQLAGCLRVVVHQAATVQVQLDGVSFAGHNLPDGVDQEADSVERALSQLRRKHREGVGELAELRLDLAQRRHGSRPSLVIEEVLEGLASEKESIGAEIQALKAAFRLITDAHARFQAEDQTRLLELISVRLADLTNERLGPVESGSGLEDAVVRAGTRTLPLTSPPLSYGELHSVLMAVRLGSADFLADLEIQPPLLVDEPFAYLDVARSEEVWSLLCQIARTRQVIVMSQDRLILEHLGVTPDIPLVAGPEAGE
ncbi:MAG: AAA family ATPase [Gemmatimonadota bacterium]